MSLYIDNNIDTVAASGGRQLDFPPRHFVKTEPGPVYRRKALSWIWKNLHGRFCVLGRFYSFEDPGEATMFLLVSSEFKI